ncbi:MAG: hypothetical protein AAFN80_15870 [Pseudomonadota bacterium]
MKEIRDKQRYLGALSSRIELLLDRVANGKASRPYVSLELLSSMLSALENEISFDEIKEALPVEAWRNDTVEVPRALLRPLVDGWLEYRDTESKKTLDECYQLTAKKSGSKPVKEKNATIDRDIMLSNLVVEEILILRGQNLPVNDTKAISIVAEKEGVSQSTARTAYYKFGKHTRAKINEDEIVAILRKHFTEK